MNFKTSFYSVQADGPQKRDGSCDAIVYSTRSGAAILITQDQATDLRNNVFANLPVDILDTLVNAKIIVPQFEDEFEACLTENKAFLKDNQTLSYTIQPTGNCQLGCTYCGQLHRKVSMTNEVMDLILARIQSINEAGNYKNLDITWYGGEPLMALDAIGYLAKKLIAYCKERKLRYSSDMITNGFTLTKSKFERLIKQYQVRAYQITIDGLPEYHDKSRATKSDRPSFQKIFDNVKDLVNSPLFDEYECKVAIRMNINRTNLDGIIPFMDFLAAEGLNQKVKLDFQGIVDWGDNNASANSLPIREFAEKEIEWMVHGIVNNFKFDALVPKRSYGPCMVVDNNSEVYDAYGNIYPCYELPYTPGLEDGANLVGNLKIPGDEKPLADVPLRNWNTLIREDRFGCNTCKFFPTCGGGCPKAWYSGRIPCPSFKFNIEQRLLIQAIRQGTNAQPQ